MKSSRIDRNIYLVEAAPSEDTSVKKEQEYLDRIGVLTYGDINFESFYDSLLERGAKIARNSLCFEDDLSLGLQMPETWYLNKGKHSLSIAMYYNFLQFKSMVKNGKLMKDNFEAGEKFGRIAVLEIYLQPGLEKMLEEENAPYFGTKKTLTECVRVLEGWDLERVPRLKSYVQYANEIEAWARDNFADYNRDEWFLGKEKSKDILRSRGTTNVREAVKAFWQNYLLNKEPRIAEDDVEIDIVWPEFREKRKPDIILVGEDIFNMNGEKNINDIVFRTSEKTVRIPMREEQNEKPFINAEFASDMFPSAEVYVVRYKGPVRFTLTKYDEVKEGVNHEVADLTRILANIL